MRQSPLSRDLLGRLTAHLEEEATCLGQVQALSRRLTEEGMTTAALATSQADIEAAVRNLADVQIRRQRLRAEIAGVWACGLGEINLSSIMESSPLAADTLHVHQIRLRDLVVTTALAVQRTQSILGSWHAIMSSLLQEVVPGSSSPIRYTSSGQRSLAIPDYAIQLRT